MRIGFLISTLLFYYSLGNAQVVNGSFENAGGPDISNWSWTCAAVLANTAPPGGGSWSLFVEGGNTQGCFPGYAYQKIPGISLGQTFVLSGWAQASSAQMTGHHVGIYFGTINNGVITLQDGDTTSSTAWTPLSVQSVFSLNAGDTAVVVLFGGLVGGPLQANGIFDLINLQVVTGVNDIPSSSSIVLFPNPATMQVVLRTDHLFTNANCTVFNSQGMQVKKIHHVSGQSLTIETNDLTAGVHYIQLEEDNALLSTQKLIIVE